MARENPHLVWQLNFEGTPEKVREALVTAKAPKIAEQESVTQDNKKLQAKDRKAVPELTETDNQQIDLQNTMRGMIVNILDDLLTRREEAGEAPNDPGHNAIVVEATGFQFGTSAEVTIKLRTKKLYV